MDVKVKVPGKVSGGVDNSGYIVHFPWYAILTKFEIQFKLVFSRRTNIANIAMLIIQLFSVLISHSFFFFNFRLCSHNTLS